MKTATPPTHCLWIDSDVDDLIRVDKIQEPAERINIGGFVPDVQGTKSEMEHLKAKIQRNPWLRDRIIRQFRAKRNKLRQAYKYGKGMAKTA